MQEDYDYIARNFFIYGLGEDYFTSLSPQLAEKYRQKFHHAEIPINLNGEFTVMKVEPKKSESYKAESMKIRPHASHDLR